MTGWSVPGGGGRASGSRGGSLAPSAACTIKYGIIMSATALCVYAAKLSLSMPRTGAEFGGGVPLALSLGALATRRTLMALRHATGKANEKHIEIQSASANKDGAVSFHCVPQLPEDVVVTADAPAGVVAYICDQEGADAPRSRRVVYAMREPAAAPVAAPEVVSGGRDPQYFNWKFRDGSSTSEVHREPEEARCSGTSCNGNGAGLRKVQAPYDPAQGLQTADACASETTTHFARIVADAVQRRVPANATGGAPFTPAAMQNLHPCVRTGRRWSVRDDVLFVMMAGTYRMNRARAFRETWGKGMDNVLMVGDETNPEVGMVALPGLKGKWTYNDAQHRSLRGLIAAAQQPEYAKYKWIFLIDDDTWVNTSELASLLFGWDARVPMIFGFQWHHPTFAPAETWPSGGAGMLFTRAAAETVAQHLYADCPLHADVNDRTIGMCAWKKGVALVHTPLFDAEARQTTNESYWRMWHSDGNVRAMVTIHRAEPALVHEYQRIVDAVPEDTQLARQRVQPQPVVLLS